MSGPVGGLSTGRRVRLFQPEQILATTTQGPTIDSAFRDYLRRLDPGEYSQLEADILEYGCRKPLDVWAGRNILLDGHHRLRDLSQARPALRGAGD